MYGEPIVRWVRVRRREERKTWRAKRLHIRHRRNQKESNLNILITKSLISFMPWQVIFLKEGRQSIIYNQLLANYMAIQRRM